MKTLFLAIMAAGLMAVSVYAQDPTPVASEVKPPLQLTISSDKAVYEVGEAIKIDLNVKNLGEVAWSVNIGALNYLTLFLKFQIVNESDHLEEQIVLRDYKSPQFDHSKDFVVLLPEKTVEKIIDIKEIWSPKKAGRYRIIAVYSVSNSINNTVYETDPRASLLQMWAGVLTSNTITIEVKGKK